MKNSDSLLFQKSQHITGIEEPLNVIVFKMGSDLLIHLTGPGAHIGAVSLSQPYIKNMTGVNSSSVSTITKFGHRDDEITSSFARKLSKSLATCVVVVGGIHIDDITSGQLVEVKDVVESLTHQIIKHLE